MIIVRVPFRISFLGGGTDYPSWYRAHGGRVLATTIDKYVYVSVRYLPRFFEHRVRVAYSKVEHTMTTADLQHPVFREVFRYLGVAQDIEAHYDADLPARSGMGSSSALTVGLLLALRALRGSAAPPMQLARDAIHVERDLVGDVVGSQDQVTVAHGGLNRIDFGCDDSITVTPVAVAEREREELERCVMLFYTGQLRISTRVAETYGTDLAGREQEMRVIADMVDRGYRLVQDGDLEAFGRLLDHAWSLKRSLSPAVSNGSIDRIYSAAKRAGALGGKLLGAGGGGFVLLIVRPDRQAAVRAALRDLLELPARFECGGSRIIYRR